MGAERVLIGCKKKHRRVKLSTEYVKLVKTAKAQTQENLQLQVFKLIFYKVFTNLF